MGIIRAYLLERINAALARVAVIYPGAKRYPLSDSVEAVPLRTLASPGSLFIEDAPGS